MLENRNRKLKSGGGGGVMCYVTMMSWAHGVGMTVEWFAKMGE